MVEKILIERRKKIYQDIKEVFGEKNQIIQLMEECAELIQASNKYIRYPTESSRTKDFAEEIGDVEIMLEQMKTYYPFLKEKIETSKKKKLLKINRKVNKIRKETEKIGKIGKNTN